MNLEKKRDRDAAYKREQRARAKGEIPHPARGAEADLPPLGDLFALLVAASRAAESRGLRLLFSLAAGPGK